MKKLLLFLTLTISAIFFNAEAKKIKGIIETNVIESTINGKPFETDSVFGVTFSRLGDTFLTVLPRNRTTDEIAIEWEGAKVNYGKVVYDTDRQIDMDSHPKSDEQIYGNQSGLMRNITSRHNVMSSGIRPLFDKKNVEKKGIPETVSVTIPVRLKNGDARLYKYKIEFRYKPMD
ncbi:MAG: hypothetical protein K2G85_05950 [Muribaculaceae bacterium]|nr:hypothetical protein [Muribaculaceae bacterium]